METRLKKYIEAKRKAPYDDLKVVYPFSLTTTFENYNDMLGDIISYKWLQVEHNNRELCSYIDCPFCLGDWK